jgi:hypothetical protein
MSSDAGGGDAPTSAASSVAPPPDTTTAAPPPPADPTTTIPPPANTPTSVNNGGGGGGANTSQNNGGGGGAQTSVVTAPNQPASTQLVTSVVTAKPTTTAPGVSNPPPSTTVIVVTNTPVNSLQGTTAIASSKSASTSTSTAAPAASHAPSHGLSASGKTAIAVAIPIIAVAGLIMAAIWFYRKRSQRRIDEDLRTEEMAAYSYNPNNDTSLAGAGVGLKDDGTMSDEGAGMAPVGAPGGGYRGWGPSGVATAAGTAAATTSSLGRKASTNASGQSWSGGPASPTNIPEVEGDNVAYGAGPPLAAGGLAAGAAAGGLHRGLSNASSTYSRADGSRASQDYAGMPMPMPYVQNNGGGHHQGYGVAPGQAQEYVPYSDNGGYYQPGPYDYGAGGVPGNGAGGPVMREGPQRRLTQIQEGQATELEHGISRNF